MIHDEPSIDVRRDFLPVVFVLGRRENESHADTLGDLDRLEHPFALGEAAEEQQVVVGLRAKHEIIGVDAVEHDVHDVQAVQKPALLPGDRHERRFRIPRPEAGLRFAGRVVERLDDGRRRQPRERQRHRVVGGLVMDDVEIARALDRGGEVQHLIELPRPHVLVVPVSVGVGRVQLRLGG